MRKVIIIGSGGAGKSTLARKLGKTLGIEVYHLDALYWQPGWEVIGEEEWMGTLSEIVSKDTWIMDGNYGSTMDMRAEASDTIIFLDFPTSICLYGILKRRIKYHQKSRPDMALGCIERLDWEFIKWVASFNRKRAPSLREKIKQYEQQGKQVHHLTARREVNLLLEQVSTNMIRRF